MKRRCVPELISAIGAASAGLSGSESRLMASVMKYCILFVVVAGVLSYFLQ